MSEVQTTRGARTWVHDVSPAAAPDARHSASLLVNGVRVACAVGADWVAAAQNLNAVLRERGIEERVLAFRAFDQLRRRRTS